VSDPLFWLGLSCLLVAISLTVTLAIALPAFQELARAARSAEKLLDTLAQELPSTLEALRLTSLEISDLTDNVDEGVKQAGRVVKRFNASVKHTERRTQEVQIAARSVLTGLRVTWKALMSRDDGS